MKRLQMRVRGDHLRRGVEQEACLAGIEHFQVIIAVTHCNGVVIDALKSPNSGEFGVLDAHFMGEDLSIGRYFQAVAEDGRHAELFHERKGKLFKGVAQDHSLHFCAQRIQEFPGAGKRIDLGDHLLHFPQAEAVLFQCGDTPAHELVIVGFVSRGAAQFGNAAFFRKGDPDLRRKDAFHIQAYNVHRQFSFFVFVSVSEGRIPQRRLCRSHRCGGLAFLSALQCSAERGYR